MKRKIKKINQFHKLIKFFLKGFILGFLSVLFTYLTIVSSRQVHGQEFIGNMLESLKEKLGFNYSLNSTQPFIFSKDTPNYRAFAGDRKSGGDNRIMLEKDGFKIEMTFLSAKFTDSKPASPSPSLILDNGKETSPSTQVSKDKEATESTGFMVNKEATVSALMNQIQQQMENIDTGLKDLSQKIDTLRQDVSQIVSKAKLVEGKRERKVSYNDILIDIDMVYRLNEGGIKQEIIMKKKDKLKNSFTFILSPDDLVYRDLGHDIWYFYDASGSAMMRLPKSFAKDQKSALTSKVTIQIAKLKGQNHLTVNVPADWITDPARVFPITVYTALEVIPERRAGYRGQIPSLSLASSSAVLSAQTASLSAEIASSSSTFSTPSATLAPTTSLASPSAILLLSPTLSPSPTLTPSPILISPTIYPASEDESSATNSAVLIDISNLPAGLNDSHE